MYFDAVTTKDQQVVVFNGTPEETRAWVQENLNAPGANELCAWDGRTLQSFTLNEYLQR